MADLHGGPRRRARARGAQRGSGRGRRISTAARADLRLEITRAYWALVTATESQRVVRRIGRAAWTRSCRDVRHQLDAGLDSAERRADGRSAGVAPAHAERAGAFDRDVAEAQLALRRSGSPPGTPLVADVAAATRARARRRRSMRSSQTARRQRADRAAPRHAHRRGRRARAARRGAARSRRSPSAAGVDYARPNPRIFPRDESGPSSWDASVNVSWPMFDGGRTRADSSPRRQPAGAPAQERLD